MGTVKSGFTLSLREIVNERHHNTSKFVSKGEIWNESAATHFETSKVASDVHMASIAIRYI